MVLYTIDCTLPRSGQQWVGDYIYGMFLQQLYFVIAMLRLLLLLQTSLTKTLRWWRQTYVTHIQGKLH